MLLKLAPKTEVRWTMLSLRGGFSRRNCLFALLQSPVSQVSDSHVVCSPRNAQTYLHPRIFLKRSIGLGKKMFSYKKSVKKSICLPMLSEKTVRWLKIVENKILNEIMQQ